MDIEIKLVGFEYEDATTIEEINRNLTALLSTPAGSCAGDRSYGIDHSCIGLPTAIAQNRLALELAEKIPLYEPRVDLIDVSCASDLQGHLVATVRIGPNDSYDPDEEEYEEDGGEEEYYDDEEDEDYEEEE